LKGEGWKNLTVALIESIFGNSYMYENEMPTRLQHILKERKLNLLLPSLFKHYDSKAVYCRVVTCPNMAMNAKVDPWSVCDFQGL
jgi:hypothetical protein